MRPTKRRINPILLLLQFAILAIVLIACGSLPDETASASEILRDGHRAECRCYSSACATIGGHNPTVRPIPGF